METDARIAKPSLDEKLALAGLLHSISFRHIIASFWSEGLEQKKELNNLEEIFDGVRELLGTIGVESGRYKFPRKLDPRKPITTAYTWMQERTISEKIIETYGHEAVFAYIFSKTVAFVYFSSDFASKVRIDDAVPHRKKLLSSQVKQARDTVIESVQEIRACQDPIRRHFGDEFARKCSEFTKLVLDGPEVDFETLKNGAFSLIIGMVPDLTAVLADVERARALREELKRVSIGRKGWLAYEKLCVKILRFLFVPPFRHIHVQSRTQDGHERRDAVLSNNNLGGFWGLVRDEFSARHVVCEFKNGEDGRSKDSLNQLRMYLSRRSIGRFGILFVRKPPSDSVLSAQRLAYDDGILILIIDDELVCRMLTARAFTRSADGVLEDVKVKFELAY